MGKKKGKVKEECCEKYKKSGKYCKDCPFRLQCKIVDKREKKENKGKKKEDKKKKHKR